MGVILIYQDAEAVSFLLKCVKKQLGYLAQFGLDIGNILSV